MPGLLSAGASVAIKEGLYWATLAAGKRANSKVVIANAWHHRSDAMSSLIAIVGVGGAMAGGSTLHSTTVQSETGKAHS